MIQLSIRAIPAPLSSELCYLGMSLVLWDGTLPWFFVKTPTLRCQVVREVESKMPGRCRGVAGCLPFSVSASSAILEHVVTAIHPSFSLNGSGKIHIGNR